ncbi:MAG: hypothetical protein WCF59_14665 [Desulfobaccales bacterium]
MDKIVPFFIILKDAAVFVGRWIQAHNGFVSAAATVVIAAFTVTLWLTNRKLWKVTIGLLEVSHEHSRHMETSITIAKESADAAKKSAEVTENAMIHSQRAYVFIQRFYRQINAALNIADIYVVLENTGETPVKHMMCSFDYISFPSDIPPDFEFPDTGKPGYGIIGRKATLDIRVLMPFTVFKDTFDKKYRTYIYGWVDYNDVLPNTPRHRTEFCHEIIFPKTGSRTFNFNIYGKYNGSDDECNSKPSPYVLPA